MRGWKAVAPIPGGHEDVEQCTDSTCGAFVRRSAEGRRESHDAEFHPDGKDDPLAWVREHVGAEVTPAQSRILDVLPATLCLNLRGTP